MSIASVVYSETTLQLHYNEKKWHLLANINSGALLHRGINTNTTCS